MEFKTLKPGACVLDFYTHEQYWSIIVGPHHGSIYLALNAGQAASTGLRVANPPAAASALLPGHTQGAQLMLLLYVNASDPRGPEEGAAPPGGQRLEEEVVVHLRVVHIQVVLRDVVERQAVGLHGGHGAILCQLEDRQGKVNDIRKDLRTVLPCAPAHFELDGVEFLLLQVISQHVPVALLLLHGKLPQGEALHPAVAGRHPQCAAPLRGHTGEALPPIEVVDRHTLKVHVAASHPFRQRLLRQRG